jgi:predicted ribonuclease YlaK
VVLDTNVLLHYQPPWQVDWTAVLGSAGPVRLVLPLRVIEELDERKYRDREKIAQRARDLLSELWKVLSPSKGGPAPLGGKPGITVEVFLDDEPRRHTLDADAEILEECRTLKAVGCPVSLVTADTGLSIRASALGIAVVPMPDKYLRNKPAPPRN